MKKKNNDWLWAFGVAGACALLLLRKREKGVGSVRGDIYRRIERGQNKWKFDFSQKYKDLSADEKTEVKDFYKEELAWGMRPIKNDNPEERFYNRLSTNYKSIAGLESVGATNLPYKPATVYNENGDVILQHYDYGTKKQQMEDALQWFKEFHDAGASPNNFYGWLRDEVILSLMHGAVKLSWEDFSKNVVTGAGEKKARSKFFAKKGEDFITIAHWAELLALNEEGGNADFVRLDDVKVRNELIDILMSIDNDTIKKKNFEEEIWARYIKAHTLPDYPREEIEVPF